MSTCCSEFKGSPVIGFAGTPAVKLIIQKKDTYEVEVVEGQIQSAFGHVTLQIGVETVRHIRNNKLRSKTSSSNPPAFDPNLPSRARLNQQNGLKPAEGPLIPLAGYGLAYAYNHVYSYTVGIAFSLLSKFLMIPGLLCLGAFHASDLLSFWQEAESSSSF